MNSYDELLSILNGVIDASHRLNKMEIKDIKKQTLELENVLNNKENQLAELFKEYKTLTQELTDLERSSEHMKSILEDLHVEEVKTRNTARLTKKTLKKTERLFEIKTKLTRNDKEVLFKRRLSLYIIKKFLGIHVEQGPDNTLNVISWSEDGPIKAKTIEPPITENEEVLAKSIWESLAEKSSHLDKWEILFEQM